MDIFLVAQAHEVSSIAEVMVRSGLTVRLRMAFRCVYCYEYLTTDSAEKHFDITRVEFCKQRKDHGRTNDAETNMHNRGDLHARIRR